MVHKILPCRCWGPSLGNTNFQLCPQIFHWIEVQRPVMPIQNLEMFFMWSSSLVAQALRLGSLSSWWFQLRFILNALTDSRRHLPKNLTIHRPVYPFRNPDQLSCHISRKAAPKQKISTPVLHSLSAVLGMQLCINAPPTTASCVDIKEFYLRIIWSQWRSPNSPGHVLAEAGGHFEPLQDFNLNPGQCSVLPILTFTTVVPALIQSHWSSHWSVPSREVLNRLLTVLKNIRTAWSEILHWSVFLYFIILSKIPALWGVKSCPYCIETLWSWPW